MKSFLKYLPIMGIAGLLALIGFFLIKSAHQGIEDSILIEQVLDEGLRLKKIHYIQDNPDEGTRWVLDADEVMFSKDRQRISFNKFHLKLEPENNISIELEGNRGDYDKTSDEMSLKGHLEGYTDNGYRISTEDIVYKQKEGHLNTDGPVEVIGPFFSVKGRGFHLNLENKTIKIISDVTTLIERESLVL
jgi:LPS export ABC transporter protein LptC